MWLLALSHSSQEGDDDNNTAACTRRYTIIILIKNKFRCAAVNYITIYIIYNIKACKQQRKKEKKRRKDKEEKKLELKTRRGESTRAHTPSKDTTNMKPGFSARQSDNIEYNVVQSLGAHHHTRIDNGNSSNIEYFIFLPTINEPTRQERDE